LAGTRPTTLQKIPLTNTAVDGDLLFSAFLLVTFLTNVQVSCSH
jgi:hypothetical protein